MKRLLNVYLLEGFNAKDSILLIYTTLYATYVTTLFLTKNSQPPDFATSNRNEASPFFVFTNCIEYLDIQKKGDVMLIR